MSDLHIPDEAREAATAAIHVADAETAWKFASAEKSAAAALAAAAPLILAAELRRLADERTDKDGAGHALFPRELRARADELNRGTR